MSTPRPPDPRTPRTAHRRPRRGRSRLSLALAAGTAALTALSTVLVGAGPAAADPGFEVDRYGQIADVDWPGKVTSDAELRADVAADEEFYGGLDPARRDSWGGDRNTRGRMHLERTGYFHIENHDGRSVLVDPDGNQFFSLGLNGLGYVGDTYTDVRGREDIYENLPTDPSDPLSAGWMDGGRDHYSFYVGNQIRKYGEWDHVDHWNRQVDRVQALGFNTAGGFSHLQPEGTPIPYIRGVDEKPDDSFGDTGFPDVFDETYGPQLHAIVAEQTADRVEDPYLIGYTFSNEIRWDRLRSEIPASRVSYGSATKTAFVEHVRGLHGGDIASFNTAWGTDFGSFDELGDASFTPTTDAAVTDIESFLPVYLDLFYGTFAGAFHAADPHHMVIGDRWFGNVMNDDGLRGMLATAAGTHLDALSYNYYTWDVSQERLADIYEKSGQKPMFLTEFHYGEPTHGLTFAIRMAGSEKEKGLLYRNYVEQAAASGMVVGTHWFEHLDQAPTGRWFQGDSGEAGAIGLIDVTDRPYREMLSSVAATNRAVYNVMDGKQQPYAYAFGPGQVERESNRTTQIPRAGTAPVIDGTLDATWPEGPTLHLGEAELSDGVAEAGVQAAFRLAHDDQYLYLHATVQDPTPMRNRYHGFDIWNGDAVELFIGPRNVEEGGGIQVGDSQIIISAQPQDEAGTAESFWYNNRADQPPITAVVTPVEGGYTIEAAIPAGPLGLTPITTGQELRFDIGFDDGDGNSRQRQFMWNGVEGNASNRDKWGRATLVETVGGDDGGIPEEKPATAQITTSATHVGGQIVVTGTGPAGAAYEVLLDGTVIGTATVLPDGTYSYPADIPAGTRPGKHTVTVRDGDTELARASVRLTPTKKG